MQFVEFEVKIRKLISVPVKCDNKEHTCIKTVRPDKSYLILQHIDDWVCTCRIPEKDCHMMHGVGGVMLSVMSCYNTFKSWHSSGPHFDIYHQFKHCSLSHTMPREISNSLRMTWRTRLQVDFFKLLDLLERN